MKNNNLTGTSLVGDSVNREIVYDNLIAKLRKNNKIKGQLYLDTTLNKIKK